MPWPLIYCYLHYVLCYHSTTVSVTVMFSRVRRDLHFGACGTSQCLNDPLAPRATNGTAGSPSTTRTTASWGWRTGSRQEETFFRQYEAQKQNWRSKMCSRNRHELHQTIKKRVQNMVPNFVRIFTQKNCPPNYTPPLLLSRPCFHPVLWNYPKKYNTAKFYLLSIISKLGCDRSFFSYSNSPGGGLSQ